MLHVAIAALLYILTTQVYALDRPVHLNGYTPETDEAVCVMWPASGDTCAAGYPSLTLPATCGTTFTGNETNTQLAALLNNPANGPVFCAPTTAVYDPTAGNFIDITRDCSGEAGGRCYLVPADTGTRTAHPFTGVQSPYIRNIRILDGAHGWVIAGFNLSTQQGATGGNDNLIKVGEDSPNRPANDVVIAWNAVDDFFLDTYAGGNAAFRHTQGERAWYVLNTIRRGRYSGDSQSQGIRLRNCTDCIVYRNYLEDPAVDGIILSNQNVANSVPGLRVTNNIVRFTTFSYASCATGLRDPTGGCMCPENAMDAKSGAAAASPGKIKGNVFTGNRRTRTNCGGSASGEALVVHLAAASLHIENNWAVNVTRGIGGATTGVGVGGSTISANVIEIIGSVTAEGGEGSSRWAINNNGWGDANSQAFVHNTLILKGAGHTAGLHSLNTVSTNRDYDMIGNAFIGAFDQHSTQNGNVVFDNLYSTTTPNTNNEPGTIDTANEGNRSPVTIDIGFIETHPGGIPTYTVEKARNYAGSPVNTTTTIRAGFGTGLPFATKMEGVTGDDSYGALVAGDVTPPDPGTTILHEQVGEAPFYWLEIAAIWGL